MNIWKKTPDLDALNAEQAGSAGGVLGIRFIEIGDDFVCGQLSVEKKTHQPYGLLHGGVSCVLAETLGSVGANLACDEHSYAVGVDISATHLNSVRSGLVTGTARPLKIGGRIQVWSIDIASDSGRPVCSSRLTVAVLDSRR